MALVCGARVRGLFIGLAVGASALLVACQPAAQGSGSPATGGASAGTAASAAPASMAEVSTPAPSIAAVDLGAAAGDVSSLSSYQEDITVTNGDQVQKLSVLATTTPVKSTQYSLKGGGTEPDTDFISIEGTGAWMRQGGGTATWTAIPTGAEAIVSMFDALAPDQLINTYALSTIAKTLMIAGTEEHNGVQATHYHLDASTAPLVGATGFPTDGTFDAWVATDGGYLVGLAWGGTDTSTGNHVMLQVDISRVNDSSISIQAPSQEQLGPGA